MLIDVHCHLQDPAYDDDREQVITRARASGVGVFAVNGTKPDDWLAVLDLSRDHHNVVPFLGLHPWDVTEAPADWFERLRWLLMSSRAGVGELGLDRWLHPRDEDAQESAFRCQLALARELERPASIHCLKASDWLLHVFKDEEPPACWLLHAFGDSWQVAEKMLERGAYLSFAASALVTRRSRTQEVIRRMPRERLLIETDAPDMAPPPPHPFPLRESEKRYRNEPALLRQVLEGVAALRKEDPDELAVAVEENSRRCLGNLLP